MEPKELRRGDIVEYQQHYYYYQPNGAYRGYLYENEVDMGHPEDSSELIPNSEITFVSRPKLNTPKFFPNTIVLHNRRLYYYKFNRDSGETVLDNGKGQNIHITPNQVNNLIKGPQKEDIDILDLYNQILDIKDHLGI